MTGARSRKSSTVFEELGFSPQAAAHLRIRCELLAAVQEVIARGRLTQERAAKVLGITQPRVSNLMSGRIDLFSTDSLIDFLARLGIGVRVTLKRSRTPGRVA